MSTTRDSKLKQVDDAKHVAISTVAYTADAAMPCWPIYIMYIKHLNDLVKSYLAYDVQLSQDNLNRFIWSNDEINVYQQAFAIARDHVLTAGPLDTLEAKVIKNPKVLLPQIKITIQLDGDDYTFQGTLEQIAMQNLDHTYTSEDPNVPVTDEGMAERLRDLRKRLLPDTLPLALNQAQLALSHVDEDEKAREAKNAVLNAAFDAIKKNNPTEARNIIKNYVKNTKPAVITNNSYFLNLLQFYVNGLEVMLNKTNELKDSLYGPGLVIDKYFFVLGMILRPFPKKLRRIFIRGVHNLLYRGKHINREVDVSDPAFIGLPGANSELGINCCYDEIGWLIPCAVIVCRFRESQQRNVFQKLYQQLHHRSKSYAVVEQLTETLTPSSLANVYRQF